MPHAGRTRKHLRSAPHCHTISNYTAALVSTHMRVISQKRFNSAYDTSCTSMHLEKQEPEESEPSSHDFGPGRANSCAPCGVGTLSDANGFRIEKNIEEQGSGNIAARCDCGQHTFLVLASDSGGDTAPTTPDSSGAIRTSHSETSITESLGGNVVGGRLTDGRRRHWEDQSGADLSSSLPTQSRLIKEDDPADIEILSATMVQAMVCKGSTEGRGDGNRRQSHRHSLDSSEGPVNALSPRPSVCPASARPQDHYRSHQPQQQHQRRRLSVSGADGGDLGTSIGSSTVLDGRMEDPSALSLDRIVVEGNGDMVVIQPSVVCDACPSCDDVCTLQDCRGCQKKRERLLASGIMVVQEAWGRTTRKRPLQENSPPGGVCVPIMAKPHGSAKGDGGQNVSYSLCEIRRHRTLASCWLVAKGQVYDVTNYLSSHPAGAIAMARKAGGQDCTEDLEFHSAKAQKLWKNLKIGSVRPCPGDRQSRRSRGGDDKSSRSGSDLGSLVGSSCSIM